MNKVKYLLFFIFLFVVSITSVYAASDYIVLLSSVNIRSGASTGYSKLITGSTGSSYNLLDSEIIKDEKMDGSCDAGWYKIDYNGSTGYVCSSYVRVYKAQAADTGVVNSECEKLMSDAGFPSSYWAGLCDLKGKHASWNFKAINTGLDWATAVEKESSCGKSLVQTSNASYVDNSCNSGYGSWKPASQTALAFYMDPRNFLTEKYIFQFEYLRYDSALNDPYITSSNTMLQNAEFHKYHSALGNNLGEIINEAGKNTDVNPVFLSSRMLQELGTKTSEYNLYSGVYAEYDGKYMGHYNFYNIGVSDSCATSKGVSFCGLDYAYNHGWNSLYNAIAGGASTLSSSYIGVGQYSTYLQKFNVVPNNPSKLYIHQYMTNIAAPSSESSSTYNTYNKLGLLDTAFTFYIPVYNNMSGVITNSSNGAVEEKNDNTPTVVPISTIVTSAGYKYNGGVISGINPNTNIGDIKGSLQSIGASSVTILNQAGNEVNDGKLGTGFTIKVANTSSSESLTVMVKGDTSGDGVINALDLLQVQKSILGTYTMNGVYETAADTSGDGMINALDLLQVQKSILGTYQIVQ